MKLSNIYNNLILEAAPRELFNRYYKDALKNNYNNFVKLASLDPTSTFQDNELTKVGKYTRWLINQYQKKDSTILTVMRNIEEDGYLIKDALKTFNNERFKRELEKKDVLQYGSVDEFLKTIEEKTDVGTEDVEGYKGLVTYPGIKEDIGKGVIDFIGNAEKYVIVRPKTKQMSCKYGVDTRWCTASEQYSAFDTYNKGEGLFILLSKENNLKPFYQFYFEGKGEFERYDKGKVQIKDFFNDNLDVYNAIFKDVKPKLDKKESLRDVDGVRFMPKKYRDIYYEYAELSPLGEAIQEYISTDEVPDEMVLGDIEITTDRWGDTTFGYPVDDEIIWGLQRAFSSNYGIDFFDTSEEMKYMEHYFSDNNWRLMNELAKFYNFNLDKNAYEGDDNSYYDLFDSIGKIGILEEFTWDILGERENNGLNDWQNYVKEQVPWVSDTQDDSALIDLNELPLDELDDYTTLSDFLDDKLDGNWDLGHDAFSDTMYSADVSDDFLKKKQEELDSELEELIEELTEDVPDTLLDELNLILKRFKENSGDSKKYKTDKVNIEIRAIDYQKGMIDFFRKDLEKEDKWHSERHKVPISEFLQFIQQYRLFESRWRY